MAETNGSAPQPPRIKFTILVNNRPIQVSLPVPSSFTEFMKSPYQGLKNLFKRKCDCNEEHEDKHKDEQKDKDKDEHPDRPKPPHHQSDVDHDAGPAEDANGDQEQ